MDKRRIFLVANFLLLLFHAAFSQYNPQSDTIVWKTKGFTDLIANEISGHGCEFITFGKNKIDWVHWKIKSKELVDTFEVNGMVDETWTKTESDGSITYNVSFHSMKGTLLIKRIANTIFIRLILAKDSHTKIDNLYMVDTFQLTKEGW